MPRGEDVEIAEPENFLPFLVALFLVESLAPTFLLFFTRLQRHSRTWLLRIANKILVIHFLRFFGFIRAQ